MADNILYYSSNLSDNATVSEPDSTVATDSNVKLNYVYRNAKNYEQRTGTMPINSATLITLPPSTDDYISMYAIPKGYHNGTGRVVAANLKDYTFGTATAEDIAFNKTAWINGKKVVGTLNVDKSTQKGTATAADILDTKTAWVNGVQLRGTMKYNFRKDVNLYAGETYTVPEGYHGGNDLITAVSLAAQTRGTATSKEVKKGYSAWVNGEFIAGELDAQAEIEELIKDTNTLTNYVLAGHKFFSKPYSEAVDGTMTDHTGEAPIQLKNGNIFYIPEGYYNGLSYVVVDGLDESTPGTATADSVLAARTAWVNGVKITGTIEEITPASTTISAGELYTIPKGYHNGTGIVVAKDLVNETIGTALAEHLRLNKTAWVNGQKITGTMQEYINEDVTIAASEHYHIPEGYHDGTGTVWAKSLASQTPANALGMHLLEGYTAWSNGVQIEGSIKSITATVVNLESKERYRIPKGYHDGLGFVVAPDVGSETEGTATENDILKDKTAWVNGVKITGILDTTLTGDATEEDVIAGASFYNTSSTEKKYGSLELVGNATPATVPKGITFYNTDPKTLLTGELELNGTALRAHVLDGYTFYNKSMTEALSGTMTNNGSVKATVKAEESYTIPLGYHDGTGKITGAPLKEQTEGTATENDILKDKTAWVNGDKITGIIETKSYQSIILDAGDSYTIPAGYYPNGFTVSAKSLEEQTQGTATAEDVVKDKIAWVNGAMITGVIPDGDKETY